MTIKKFTNPRKGGSDIEGHVIKDDGDHYVVKVKCPLRPGTQKMRIHKSFVKEEQIDEVLDIAQRKKRAMIAKKNQPKLKRGRKIAQRKRAPKAIIKKRAAKLARHIVRTKFAGKMGANYANLSPSQKINIDKLLEKKQGVIKKIAMRLIPKVQQLEAQRLAAFLKGRSMKNVNEEQLDELSKKTLKSYVSKANKSYNKASGRDAHPDEYMGHSSTMSKRARGINSANDKLTGKKHDGTYSTMTKKMTKKPWVKEETSLNEKFELLLNDKQEEKVKSTTDKKNKYIVMYNKFKDVYKEDTSEFLALSKKSDKSGISIGVLGEVFLRGLESYDEAETRVTQEQYAFARVNSYINEGKTYFNEDSDLHEFEDKNIMEISKRVLRNYASKVHDRVKQDTSKNDEYVNKRRKLHGDDDEVVKQADKDRKVLANRKKGYSRASKKLGGFDQQKHLERHVKISDRVADKYGKTKHGEVIGHDPDKKGHVIVRKMVKHNIRGNHTYKDVSMHHSKLKEDIQEELPAKPSKNDHHRMRANWHKRQSELYTNKAKAIKSKGMQNRMYAKASDHEEKAGEHLEKITEMQVDSSKRETGTDSAVKNYTDDTPGQDLSWKKKKSLKEVAIPKDEKNKEDQDIVVHTNAADRKMIKVVTPSGKTVWKRAARSKDIVK